MVLPDHHGRFNTGVCCFSPSVTDPERAELLACKRAVELAREMQVGKVAMEKDSLGFEAKLEVDGLDRSVHGPLVEDIKRDFEDHSVLHVRRSGNEVAHKLAKDGCRNKLCRT